MLKKTGWLEVAGRPPICGATAVEISQYRHGSSTAVSAKIDLKLIMIMSAMLAQSSSRYVHDACFASVYILVAFDRVVYLCIYSPLKV